MDARDRFRSPTTLFFLLAMALFLAACAPAPKPQDASLAMVTNDNSLSSFNTPTPFFTPTFTRAPIASPVSTLTTTARETLPQPSNTPTPYPSLALAFTPTSSPLPNLTTAINDAQPQPSKTPTPYLVSAPTPTPFPSPTATLSPLGDIQPVPTGFVYLGARDTMALGFNMSAGGALGSLLFNGRELVDYTDYGRYIQFSTYDGNDKYGPRGDDPYGNWGWNPIQAGSKAGGSSIIGAQVLEYRTADGSIYIKSLGKEWGQYDQDSDVIYETWAWQREGYFQVYTRATHTGDDTHAASTQEFPAAYFATSLTHMFGYFGESPFTGAPVAELDHVARQGEIAGMGNCPRVSPTEYWAAFGTLDHFGLILAVPPQGYLGPQWNICLLYDRPRVGYIGPIAYFDVPPHAVREITYYLVPGPIEAARGTVYDLIPHTTWSFDLNSLEGWRSNSDSARAADGTATVYLSPDDWLTSSGDLRISAAVAPTIILSGRTQETEAMVCLSFITTMDATWDAEKSECLTVAPGDLRDYEFSLKDNPAWNETVVRQFRLSTASPTWLEIDALAVSQNGIAWEFQVPGDSEGWVAWHHLDPLQTSDGKLLTRSLGNDPYMNSPGVWIDAASFPTIEIRMKLSAGSGAQLFFMTDAETYFVEEKSLVFSPLGDGRFHTYALDMSAVEEWQGVITQLRLDPTNTRAAIEIDYIRILGNP